LNTCATISPATWITSNKRAAACDLNGEMVILQPDSGVYFGLNAVGASIWNYIQTERSVEELVLHMMNEYEVSRAECEPQVISLLQDMVAHRLVEVQFQATGLLNGEAA
jgi:hypothetical protein